MWECREAQLVTAPGRGPAAHTLATSPEDWLRLLDQSTPRPVGMRRLGRRQASAPAASSAGARQVSSRRRCQRGPATDLERGGARSMPRPTRRVSTPMRSASPLLACDKSRRPPLRPPISTPSSSALHTSVDPGPTRAGGHNTQPERHSLGRRAPSGAPFPREPERRAM